MTVNHQLLLAVLIFATCIWQTLTLLHRLTCKWTRLSVQVQLHVEGASPAEEGYRPTIQDSRWCHWVQHAKPLNQAHKACHGYCKIKHSPARYIRPPDHRHKPTTAT